MQLTQSENRPLSLVPPSLPAVRALILAGHADTAALLDDFVVRSGLTPVHPHDDFNPHNARDCKYWNALVTEAMLTRPPTSKTWPYIEFTVAEGARIIQTNEDGAVWWSDDVQCWGSDDRFPPF